MSVVYNPPLHGDASEALPIFPVQIKLDPQFVTSDQNFCASLMLWCKVIFWLAVSQGGQRADLVGNLLTRKPRENNASQTVELAVRYPGFPFNQIRNNSPKLLETQSERKAEPCSAMKLYIPYPDWPSIEFCHLLPSLEMPIPPTARLKGRLQKPSFLITPC
ncbi:hypothetical protein ElyMa_003849400 [Elysia marginata]|uniref:Uncharacterized protein n=1 Tax=Elysia marginata TaxID=1093978 RepID=A0AAV4FI55_9GAST|nr:hypothetical protein ElyMa_003849400 [Elysia marginata]